MADATRPLSPRGVARLLTSYHQERPVLPSVCIVDASISTEGAGECVSAGFLGHGITPEGRAYVENVVGRLVPLTNADIRRILAVVGMQMDEGAVALCDKLMAIGKGKVDG